MTEKQFLRTTILILLVSFVSIISVGVLGNKEKHTELERLKLSHEEAYQELLEENTILKEEIEVLKEEIAVLKDAIPK